MEFRNPVYNRFGTVDCEVNHPIFGWVPFTASPDDDASKEIYDAAVEAGGVAPYVPPAPPTIEEQRTNMHPLSQRQLRLTIGKLSVDAVNSMLADDWDATTEWNTASEFHRLHPLIVEMGPQLGFTPEQIDDMWAYALTIK